MRKRPEIPEDVFFDDAPAQPEPDEGKPLKRQPGTTLKKQGARKEPQPSPAPPTEDEPKYPVTLYLTRSVLYRLEEARFLLLTEHGVKTSKSAIANYALDAGRTAGGVGERREALRLLTSPAPSCYNAMDARGRPPASAVP